MVGRMKRHVDQSQLALFGESSALGVKPTEAKSLPISRALDGPLRPSSVIKTKPPIVRQLAKQRDLGSLPPEIVRPPEAASLLSVSLSLLKKWRLSGGGPRFVRLGGRAIGYRRCDLLDWIDGLTR